MPISFFFENGGEPEKEGGLGEAQDVAGFVSTKEGMELNRAFFAITDTKVRQSIVALTKSLAAAWEEPKMTSVAEPAAMSFRLITLGELTLRNASGAAVSCPDKVLLLLAFLCTQPDGARHRRDLANLLWPNAQDEAADTNLRSALRRMRLALGETPVVIAEGARLRRNAAVLSCDLDLMPTADRPVARLAWLTGAVSRGFLDRDLRHEPAIEHWITGVRTTHLLLLRTCFFQCLTAHRGAAGDEALQAAAVPLLVHDRPTRRYARRCKACPPPPALPAPSPVGTVAFLGVPWQGCRRPARPGQSDRWFGAA